MPPPMIRVSGIRDAVSWTQRHGDKEDGPQSVSLFLCASVSRTSLQAPFGHLGQAGCERRRTVQRFRAADLNVARSRIVAETDIDVPEDFDEVADEADVVDDGVVNAFGGIAVEDGFDRRP